MFKELDSASSIRVVGESIQLGKHSHALCMDSGRGKLEEGDCQFHTIQVKTGFGFLKTFGMRAY